MAAGGGSEPVDRGNASGEQEGHAGDDGEDHDDPLARLDVSLLQDRLINPVLGTSWDLVHIHHGSVVTEIR